jgi:hypothetical protein
MSCKRWNGYALVALTRRSPISHSQSAAELQKSVERRFQWWRKKHSHLGAETSQNNSTCRRVPWHLEADENSEQKIGK